MAITIEQSSSINNNAYNRIEYVLSSDNISRDKFKYLINLLYNNTIISSISPKEFKGNIYSELTISNNYFSKGDRVFIQECGIYNILDVDTTNNTIIVDVDYNDIFTKINLGVSIIGLVINFAVNPEPSLKLGIIDLSNTLKNFCTHKLEDTNGLYWSPEVIRTYKLVLGEEYEHIYEFTDNAVTGSKTSFVNPNLSSSYTGSTPFRIGDKIKVQQDQYEWTYNDNVFISGNRLGFTGSLISSGLFPDESQIFITGQITNPQYNGYTSVYSSSGDLLVVNKDFGTSSPPESGSIFGHLKPSYNSVTTITNLYYDTGSNQIVLSTDLDWEGSSPAIGGTIKFSDGTLIKDWSDPTDTKLSSTGKFDLLQELSYSPESFHIKDTTPQTYLASTIISFNIPGDYKHRIEKNTKSWVLIKPGILSGSSYNSSNIDVSYEFYDSSNSLLGTGSFAYSGSINFTDDSNGTSPISDYYGIYIPNGLDQLISSPNFTSSLSSYVDSVDNYKLKVTGSWGNIQPIPFKINPDCNPSYGIYNLLFKDSLGSFISYPFIYKSMTSTEVDSNSYYKKPGKLNTLNSQKEYNSYDRGRTNLYKRYNDKMRLTSGFVRDEENIIIKDLLTSPEVYLQDEDNNLIAVQILNTDIELGKSVNTNIYNYTLDISYSIDQIRF